MKIHLVVEVELETNKIDNVAVFSTREKAKRFIEIKGNNGDCCEYGITEFTIDNWEIKGEIDNEQK